MGGEITVTSALGKGSTFTITLPGVREGTAPEKPETPEKPEIPEIPEKPQSATHRRILIVDDQKMNLIVLKAMLKKLCDFDVVMAADGKQALAALEAPDAQPFDMVLTDMWMPELDGEGLVRAIRANAALSALPVYVITADVEMLSKFETAGFTGILLKPVTVDKLRGML
jgi:CheY-like chemotaxis protein